MVASLSWGGLLATIIRRRRLVRPEVDQDTIDRVRRAYTMGPIVYALSVALALWNAWLGLTLCAPLWIVWTRLCYQARAAAE